MITALFFKRFFQQSWLNFTHSTTNFLLPAFGFLLISIIHPKIIYHLKLYKLNMMEESDFGDCIWNRKITFNCTKRMGKVRRTGKKTPLRAQQNMSQSNTWFVNTCRFDARFRAATVTSIRQQNPLPRNIFAEWYVWDLGYCVTS